MHMSPLCKMHRWAQKLGFWIYTVLNIGITKITFEIGIMGFQSNLKESILKNPTSMLKWFILPSIIAGLPAISQNEIPWFFHEFSMILAAFSMIYMKWQWPIAHVVREKNIKSSMRENLRKQNSMIFPGFILKFHDFSMILAFFSNSMIFPGLENDFAVFQNSMIFPWRWKSIKIGESWQC